METNIYLLKEPGDNIAELFSIIGQPARIQILLILGMHEACVCHLEAVMGIRQASISQHLMTLRKAGLVATHREGRHIYYHLVNPQILQVVDQCACFFGYDLKEVQEKSSHTIQKCNCPQCNPGIDQKLACRKSIKAKSM